VEIRGATLQICSHTSSLTAAIDCQIRAEEADDPDDFTGSERAPSLLLMTDSSQTWPWQSDAAWAPNAWYESPDFTGVIQEIVNRPGWSPGNALVVILSSKGHTNDERRIWSFEGEPQKAARLTISYQPN
jgi:type IV pilus assembly protein PilY1